MALVEVFVDEEIAAESDTEADLRHGVAERLGLVGQLAVSSGFKYRTPSEEQLLVYSTLFPKKVRVEQYADEPIPLRVLDVLERAKASGLFEYFCVWCPETRAADPVLVGHTTDPRGTWFGSDILLARWGSSLDEWPAMLKAARDKIVEKVRREAEEALAHAEVRCRRARSLDPEKCDIVAAARIA